MVLYLFLNQSCQFLCGLRPPLLHPNSNPAIPTRDPARRHSDPTLTLYPNSSFSSLPKTQINTAITIANQLNRRDSKFQVTPTSGQEDQKYVLQQAMYLQ
ncbi:hypothetical protein BJX76DRAFT_341071 [Aspergillus varians]